MLIYANEVALSSSKLSETTSMVKNLSIDTENTSVGDLVEKLEHFIFFTFKYVNLC